MTVPTGCLTAGAPPTLHTIRIMLSICLHLLRESESARRPLYLRTRVSTFPEERAECRHAGTLSDGFQPVPDVSPANASDPSRSLERTGSASAAPAPSHQPHPIETACPAATQIRCSPDSSAAHKKPSPDRNKSVPEGLHPASRAQTLIRPNGVMRVPSSAPQPAAAPLHPPHPSPSTRPPSSGQARPPCSCSVIRC